MPHAKNELESLETKESTRRRQHTDTTDPFSYNRETRQHLNKNELSKRWKDKIEIEKRRRISFESDRLSKI